MRKLGKCILSLVLASQLPGAFFQVKTVNADAADFVVAPILAAGYYHGVSLTSSGEVWSWGRGDYGQMGNGSSASRAYPVLAQGMTKVVAVDSGVRGSIAVKADGTVWTWGSNSNGQLGVGSLDNSTVPGRVPGLSDVIAVSGALSYHSMALKRDGTVWAWGKNDNGELGDGTTTQSTTPVQVAGLTGVKAIAAGGYFSLALKNDGTVWAWGYNGNGELGDGTNTQRTTPVQVAGLSGVKAIAAGGSHALALKADGTAWAWGQNTYGTLGDGTRTNRNTPVKIAGLEHVAAISGGGYHSMALDGNGAVWSWGNNGQGQLGLGTGISSSYVPRKVEGIEDVRLIAASGFSSLVMKKDGTVWGWGLNSSGELANGTSQSQLSPVKSKAVLDTTPPDTGNGVLTVSDVTFTEAALSWAKASDNLLGADELRYRLYMSEQGNLATVSEIERNGNPIGDYAANKDSERVTGLSEGKTYYFNVIVQDGAGNKKAYSMLKVATKKTAIHTLIYDGNGHTGGSVPQDSALYAQGDQATVMGAGGLQREGYAFGGWNTAPDGSGTNYATGSLLTFPAGDMVLYAKWTEIPAPEPSGASLKSLDVFSNAGEPVSLNPAFSGEVFDYTAEVPNGVNAVTVTTQVYRNGSSVTASVYAGTKGDSILVLGPLPLTPGESSPLLPLAAGGNRIELAVMAENGTRQKYTVVVSRKAGETDPTDPTHPTDPTDPDVPSNPSDPPPGDPDTGGGSPSRSSGSKHAASNTQKAGEPPSPSADRAAEVQVKLDGETMAQIGTSLLQEAEGRTSIVVQLNAAKLTENILSAAENPVIVISLRQAAGNIVVELPGAVVQALDSRGGRIELGTPNGYFMLPAAEAGVQRWAPLAAEANGESLSADRLTVLLEIAASAAGSQDAAQAAANANGFTLEAPPADFRIAARYDGQTVSLNRFGAFVEKGLPLPEGTAPGEVTGAIVIHEDGTVAPVPMRIVSADGRKIAAVSSLSGGSFALISKQAAFADVPADHFAGPAIGNLAARWIVQGFAAEPGSAAEGNGRRQPLLFKPAAPVSRGQFTEMLIRALGLGGEMPNSPETSFSDAGPVNGYGKSAAVAKEYGILQGYADGTFRPDERLTRQEAIAMLARTFRLLGLEDNVSQEETDGVLAGFADRDNLADWAKPAVSALIQAGIVQGAGNGLQPRGQLTRAETAVMIDRLLQQAGLIQ
ncbi:S-layer homology domain-containing protein [Paenibacillus macerans]|nr:S-layer homology domain-containing protein [Paenibacillus macerans]